MLVSGGKILALSKVETDKTLVGLGTPDSPLGIKDPEQYAQKDWVEETFVSGDYLEKNYWTSAATSAAVEARIRQIPGATEYTAGNGIKIEDYIISLQASAFEPYALTSAVNQKFNETSSWASSTFQPKGNYAKTEDVNKQFSATSAWALATFRQPSGNYVTSAEFDDYKTEVKTEFENTSAWAKDTFVSANEFEEYKTEVTEALEGKLNKSDFNTYSAGIDDDLGNISADLAKKLYTSATENWDVQKYTEGEGIKIENHAISVSGYVTSAALDEELNNYYTKAETWSSTAISNEFSSTSAWANDTFQTKGDYITTDEADERYLPLSANLHNVIVTSEDESVTVTPTSADGIVTYDLHVDPPAAEVKISGENGVSAQYDEAASAWLVGLEQANSATYMGTQSTQTELLTDATPENPETLSGFGVNTQIYGNDIAVTTDTVTLEKGMYHVDLQIDVTVPGGDPSYYTTTIKPTLSYSVLTHVIDGSYAHTETLDLSFIIDVAQATSSSALQFKLEGLPAGASYTVKNLQVCEIVTVDSELYSQGGTYAGGDAIAIDAQNKINVKYNSASGIGLDENGQLMVKLGKGLTFDTSGAAAGTLTLDNVTEEVVETVTALKAELDSKLTVNFNYPQITDNNYDFGTLKIGDTCICQLFSVPLQHEIIENRTVFSVYVKDTGYSQANVILGIFEYDFDANDGTGSTNWVCDTGPVSLAKETTHDKLEFPVTHVNPDRHVLRSDRAYYAVLAMKSDGGNGIFLASCPGYSPNVNSNPTLNWRYSNATGLDFVNTSGSLANTEWWNSGYNEKNDMNRFFLQIRNKAEV